MFEVQFCSAVAKFRELIISCFSRAGHSEYECTQLSKSLRKLGMDDDDLFLCLLFCATPEVWSCDCSPYRSLHSLPRLRWSAFVDLISDLELSALYSECIYLPECVCLSMIGGLSASFPDVLELVLTGLFRIERKSLDQIESNACLRLLKHIIADKSISLSLIADTMAWLSHDPRHSAPLDIFMSFVVNSDHSLAPRPSMFSLHGATPKDQPRLPVTERELMHESCDLARALINRPNSFSEMESDCILLCNGKPTELTLSVETLLWMERVSLRIAGVNLLSQLTASSADTLSCVRARLESVLLNAVEQVTRSCDYLTWRVKASLMKPDHLAASWMCSHVDVILEYPSLAQLLLGGLGCFDWSITNIQLLLDHLRYAYSETLEEVALGAIKHSSNAEVVSVHFLSSHIDNFHALRRSLSLEMNVFLNQITPSSQADVPSLRYLCILLAFDISLGLRSILEKCCSSSGILCSALCKTLSSVIGLSQCDPDLIVELTVAALDQAIGSQTGSCVTLLREMVASLPTVAVLLYDRCVSPKLSLTDASLTSALQCCQAFLPVLSFSEKQTLALFLIGVLDASYDLGHVKRTTRQDLVTETLCAPAMMSACQALISSTFWSRLSQHFHPATNVALSRILCMQLDEYNEQLAKLCDFTRDIVEMDEVSEHLLKDYLHIAGGINH